jgi:signal transduction histidine kinase
VRALRALAPASVWRLWLVLACALACGPADAADAEPKQRESHHVTQAEVLVEHADRFEDLPIRLDPASLGSAPRQQWQSTALPYIWPRKVMPGEASGARQVLTTWIRVDLGSARPAPGGTWAYLPRWQTIGQIAVYGDDRLLYRSHADLVWNGFNHPLLIPLDDDGSRPLPRHIVVRIDSQAAAGGAVSSLYIGSAEALRPAFDLRRVLQVRVPELSGVAVLGLGAFALAIWLLRRRESMYLLFAVFTVLATARGLHFHMGLEPLPIPSEWFGWMTVNAVHAMLVGWYFFVASLVPLPARWVGRALLWLAVLAAVATLPPLAVLPGMDTLAPLSYLLAIAAGVPAIAMLVWAAFRHGGREGIFAALIGLSDVVVAVHDWMMQNYYIGPEDFYYGAILMPVRLVMFTYVVLTRYVGAVDEAEQANVRLARRLREREAELAGSYDQLREVQQRQVLVRERQRLMQDIHDGMGAQLMSALRVAESGQLSETQMAAVLRECIEDLKLTVDSLEPVEADLLLLLATLRYRLTPRLQGSGLQLQWDVTEMPTLDWLDPRSALHVLRILQEGIANVIQHARATELRVATGQADGGVYVALSDNGRGFDAAGASAAAAGAGAGKGLSNMLRRAGAIGGRISWEPADGGTRFRLWLPIRKGAA